MQHILCNYFKAGSLIRLDVAEISQAPALGQAVGKMKMQLGTDFAPVTADFHLSLKLFLTLHQTQRGQTQNAVDVGKCTARF